MSFYSPEIAVLHAAFSLVQKQFGGKKLLQISSEKCDQAVKVISHAVEEIVNGLEDDHSIKDQVHWNEKLHDLLLYKVCQSHDTSQPIIDENTVFDKTEMLAQILPDFDGSLYTELVKKCGWTSTCLLRLESIDAEIGQTICREILHCLLSVSSNCDSTIGFYFTLLEFILSRVLTESLEDSFLTIYTSEGNFLSYLVQTVLKGLNSCDLKLYFDNMLKLCNNNDVQETPDDLETSHLFQLQLLGVLIGFSSDTNKHQLLKWMCFNVNGQEIDHQGITQCFHSEIFFEKHGLGKYSNSPLVLSKMNPNFDLILTLKDTFPWKLWQSVITKLGACSSTQSQHEITFTRCPLHVQVVCRPSDKAKTVKLIHLQCSSQMILDTQKLSSKIYSQIEDGHLPSDTLIPNNIPDNVDLDTVIWRIDCRQPGYKDCIGVLLSNKSHDSASFWKCTRLVDVLMNNIDLLVEDVTLMRLYELYIELEDYLSKEELSAIRHLILGAFVKLGKDLVNKHVVHLYTKYRYWPREERGVRSGEVTAVFNKLTSSTSRTEMEELYKQLLQDPELVIENIIDRAITSKNQVVMYTEILKYVPDVCKALYREHGHMTLLISTLTSYLLSRHLSYKELRNSLDLVTGLCNIEEPESLIDHTQLLVHVAIPNLNVEHLNNKTSQTILTSFSLELLLEVIEGVPKKPCMSSDTEKYLRKLFNEVPFPVVFLCICELAHECMVYYEDDDVLMNEKMRTRDSIQRFWIWLDQWRFLWEEFLQPAGPWLEENLTCVDLNIQLLAAGYIVPDRMEEICQNMVNNFIVAKDDNTLVNLLQLVTVSQTVSGYVTKHLSTLPFHVDYHELVVALTQVLPTTVEVMWPCCIEFVNQLMEEKRVPTTYRVWCRNIPNQADHTELLLSQILQEVTSLLQFTDLSQRKLLLSGYLKSYVKFLKEIVLKPTTKPSEEQAFILAEVFCHIIDGIVWMEEADGDPCYVVLLDIACSLQDLNIDSGLRDIIILNMKDKGKQIKSLDTASMIDKKLTDIGLYVTDINK